MTIFQLIIILSVGLFIILILIARKLIFKLARKLDEAVEELRKNN